MPDIAAIGQTILDAFTGKMTWLEASDKHPLEDVIATFYRTRVAMQKLLENMSDKQVAYHDPNTPVWSLSETVTHLVFSQAGYYNQLLEITTSDLPHIAEAAKGFGEGAKAGIRADDLRSILQQATESIRLGIENTKEHQKSENITTNALFGRVNYQTWMLLLLGHEMDHVRQATLMRRLARAAISG
jgi:uncharacterized damage-inducible protein DinB